MRHTPTFFREGYYHPFQGYTGASGFFRPPKFKIDLNNLYVKITALTFLKTFENPIFVFFDTAEVTHQNVKVKINVRKFMPNGEF